MQKLKIKSIGLLIILSFLSLSSFSQNYENQSSEVQTQMNLNKTNGLPIWNDIVTSFNVYTEGLDASEENILLERAGLRNEIISISIKENGKVIVVCKGGTRFAPIKGIFSNIVSNIPNLEENSYVQIKE